MQVKGFLANQTSDDHGWSSVTGAKDGGRGPCLVASLGRPVLGPSMKEHFRRVWLRRQQRPRFRVIATPLGLVPGNTFLALRSVTQVLEKNLKE